MAGFLFAHGPQGIVDSLDVSVSTLGYEDSDLPPCIGKLCQITNEKTVNFL